MKRKDIDLVAGVIKGLEGNVKQTNSPIRNVVYWRFVTAFKKVNGNFNEQAFNKDCGIGPVPDQVALYPAPVGSTVVEPFLRYHHI